MSESQNGGQSGQYTESPSSEYLGMSVGAINDQPKLVLTLRPDIQKSLAPQNFAIPAEQAIRLYQDLGSLIESYKCLRAGQNPNDGNFFQEPAAAKPTRTSRRKKT